MHDDGVRHTGRTPMAFVPAVCSNTRRTGVARRHRVVALTACTLTLTCWADLYERRVIPVEFMFLEIDNCADDC
jgi:hypothetical protein